MNKQNRSNKGFTLVEIMIVCGILIRLESPGPVFYRQERVGRGGRPFTGLKLRSMRADAEDGTGPVQAAAA